MGSKFIRTDPHHVNIFIFPTYRLRSSQLRCSQIRSIGVHRSRARYSRIRCSRTRYSQIRGSRFERWLAAELRRHKGRLLRQGHSEAAEELP